MGRSRKKGKRKSTSAATRAPATTRSTAGTGYDFEDQVAAWLLLGMMRGAPAPMHDNSARELAWQSTKPIDDLEIRLPPSSGVIAVSCKGNVQVTARGLPADFVEPGWRRWRETKQRNETSKIMLATRDSHREFNSAWTDIKDWCREGPSVAFQRIGRSKKHSIIVASISDAVRRHEPGATNEDIIAFINDLGVMPLDFQLEQSKSEVDAIVACRDLLVDGQTEEARKLWRAILAEANTKRLAGGTLNLTQLIAVLRSQFALKDHPDFAPSLLAVQALSTERMGLIELALPSGHAIDRKGEADLLQSSLARSRLTIVHGDSGVGKSALVLTAIKASGIRKIVWLRGSDFEQLANTAERLALRVRYPMDILLPATATPSNVLVIDSAERMTQEGVRLLATLVTSLSAHDAGCQPLWRIVVVSQSAGLDDLEILRPLIATNDDCFEIGSITTAEVRRALLAIPELAWMASDSDAVEGLRNLKTLAWVIQAQHSFQQTGSAGASSRISIAGRLWHLWTEDRLGLQRILMAMAEREAQFGGTLPISALDSVQLSEIDRLPAACPVVITSNRHLEFRHDLASDWTRYQRLREMSDDPLAWAAFAANPMWHAAIRMLGQQLLREDVDGRAKWDRAFELLETAKGELRSGADLLLDALCLDPLADRWLNDRTELLLEQHGKRLARMLERFHHIATMPALAVVPDKKGLDFFIEAMFRRPIYGRWGPVVRFIHRHTARIAPLGLAPVAKLCETWLKGTPLTLSSGVPTYFRKELAEAAVATARELQLQLLQRWMIHGKEPEQIYAATFAAAPDLPDDVSTWALEMAQRRPVRDDILARKNAYERDQAQKHIERMKSDAEYRERHDNARRASGSGMVTGRRKLKPWLLGARGRIDNEFQRSCTHRNVLPPMMLVRPHAAAEVLLACIIDDQPEEERDGDLRDGLGLAFDHDSNPPAYWKSPFYAFLHAQPQAALQALLRLVDFSTERWRDRVERRSDEPAPSVELMIAPGETKRFWGGGRVYRWSYERNSHSGQLASALAALERWLWDRCEAGQDVRATIETILRDSSSVAILAVLINLGKAHPGLFDGPLTNFLSVIEFHFWDRRERDELQHRFDAFSWSRAGEHIFQLARDWMQASFRSLDISVLALERQRANPAFAAEMHAAIQSWQTTHSTLGLTARQFVAALDHANHDRQPDGTYRFRCPSELMQTDEPPATPSERDALLTAENLARHTLGRVGILSDEFAADVTHRLNDIEKTTLLSAEEKRAGQTALASLLLIKAEQQLDRDVPLRQRCIDLVRSGIADSEEDHPYGRRMRFQVDTVWDFSGSAVIACWLRQPEDPLWCEQLLILMTGMNEGAVDAVISSAFQHRERLGDRWWRLIQLATYWAALLVLKPRGDDDASEQIWQAWRARLRRQKINVATSLEDAIGLTGLARRVERMYRSRRGRSKRRRHHREDAEGTYHLSWGLDTRALSESLGWALGGRTATAETPIEQRRDVALAVWEFETWRLFEETGRKDHLPCELGYAALDALARAASELPSNEAARCWQPVLRLGSQAAAAISRFINELFNHFSGHPDPTRMVRIWREVLTSALSDQKLTEGRSWYDGQKVLRSLLGFSADSLIYRLPDAAQHIGQMKDLYERWAGFYLPRDEDNRTCYAYFLMAPVAALLLADGTRQVARALMDDTGCHFGRRDRTGESLVELVEHILSNDLARGDESLRTAILSIADILVQHRVPNALALQDRIRRMKR